MNILNPVSPANDYINYAEEINLKKGHENLGFLSFEKGFMPLNTPLEKLPYPFSKWDEVAKKMPFHYKNQSLRKALQDLPTLDANNELLPDKFLCRASMLLSMLAHAYVRNERNEDLNIPNSITIPWKVITKRLNRPQPFLSYIDLIIYNWKQKDNNGPYKLENLELLVPTVNNQEENVFYLTQTEIAFRTKGIVNFVVQIQDAIIADKKEKVITGLKELKKVVSQVTESIFLKINPNPRSKTYVDPVIWAKTVAPFAVPLKEGVQGPSGTSSPFFHLIDTFIERNKYDTILGKEALFIREWYPEHWRNFINAVSKVSILDYIKKCDDENLDGAFYDFIEAYSGDKGFLGVHRRKVYGYLQMAFKVGRSVTIGGFSGLFKERTWEEVDDELETTRLERYAKKELKCPYSGVITNESIGGGSAKHIVLDVENKGISYRPGDRCAITPKNTKDKVSELLKIIGFTGNEFVLLNEEWKDYFEEFYNEKIKQTTLRKFLFSAKLGNAIKVLQICGHIAPLIKLDIDGKLSLKSLVCQLQDLKLDVKQYLIPYLSIILKPEEQRMYSISSGFDKQKIELTVGNTTAVKNNNKFKGVASSYLHSEEVNEDSKIPIKIIRPLNFSLPQKKNIPIYLFAAGSGIAPFKGFWEVLEKRGELSKLSIYYSVKNIKNIVFKEDLERIFFEGNCDLNIIATREFKELDKKESISQNKLTFKDTASKRINDLISEKTNSKNLSEAIIPQLSINHKGCFYICGKAGFASMVLDSIKNNINKAEQKAEKAKEVFYRLFSENRLMLDIFTSPSCISDSNISKFDLSDVIEHNNSAKGYWVAINQKVYDLTEFKEIHPGGDKIITDNAGRDATHEFERANHHKSKEIMSMLSIYCIGNLRKVNFESEILRVQYQDWVNALHLTTEMQNTFVADFSFKNKKTTLLCDDKEISNYKVALVIENIKRFNLEYVKNIQQIFKDLFYTCSNYKSISKEFDNLIEIEVDLCLKNISYSEKALKNYWEGLEKIEQKNMKLLSLVRKLLRGGVKFFESHDENTSLQFDDVIDIILDRFTKELKSLNNQVKTLEGYYLA